MQRLIQTFALVLLCIVSGTSSGELTKGASVRISISVSIPAKNWRDTHRLVLASTMPTSLSDCIQSIPQQELKSKKPAKVLSTCLMVDSNLKRDIELIRSTDDLRVFIAGV